MDSQTATLLSNYLPPELVSEIDVYLISYYSRQNAIKVAELIKRNVRFYQKKLNVFDNTYIIYDDIILRYEMSHIMSDFFSYKYLCGLPIRATYILPEDGSVKFQKFKNRYPIFEQYEAFDNKITEERKLQNTGPSFLTIRICYSNEEIANIIIKAGKLRGRPIEESEFDVIIEN